MIKKTLKTFGWAFFALLLLASGYKHSQEVKAAGLPGKTAPTVTHFYFTTPAGKVVYITQFQNGNSQCNVATSNSDQANYPTAIACIRNSL